WKSALIAILFASRAEAQLIQGTVVVTAVRPPERIEVLLEKDGQVIIRSQTDSSGAFAFRGMPYGGYSVIARADGYGEARAIVDLSAPPAGVPVQVVNLQL